MDYDLAPIGFIDPGLGASPPVLSQMVPGSSFLNQQNGSSALSYEAIQASARVGLSTQLPNNRQPFSVFWSNSNEHYNTMVALFAFATSMYGYYANHPDDYLARNAYLWLDMADMLANVQGTWFMMNGSFAGGSIYSPSVSPNDGVVPLWSSVYPGGESIFLASDVHGSIAHRQQQGSAVVRSRVVDFLVSRGVQSRPPTVTPPLFTAHGATVVQPGATCFYSGGSSIGEHPLLFEWYQDGDFRGVGPSMFIQIPPEGSFISVTVFDVNGLVGSGGIQVTTDPGAASCYVE